MWRKPFAIWLLLVGSAFAVDGLPSGVPFDIPVSVNGKTTTGKALIQATADADKPLVIFYVGGDGTLQTLSYTLRRADSPNPQPQPQPDPTPKPNKVSFLYLIHESKDSTPAQAIVRDDPSWRSAAEARGIRWLVMDADEAAKKFPVAAQKAKTAGLPCLVWLDSMGVAEAATVPKTAAEIVAEIARRAK